MSDQITEAVARKVLEVVDAGLVAGVGYPIPGEMCVEAAVCYALGLPHGDDPACVSRPLRALKIRLNDSRWSSDKARASGLRRLAVAQLGSARVLNDTAFTRRVVDLAIRKSVPAALRSTAFVCKISQHKANLLDAAFRCEKEGTRAAALAARKIAIATATATAAAAVFDTATAAVNAADTAAANTTAAIAAIAAAADTAAAATVATVAAAAAANAAAADADTAAATATAAAAAVFAADTAAAAAATDADADAYAYATTYIARDQSLTEYAEDVVQILIGLKAPGCQWLPLTEAM